MALGDVEVRSLKMWMRKLGNKKKFELQTNAYTGWGVGGVDVDTSGS